MSIDGPNWATVISGEAEAGLLWEIFHENSKSSRFDDVLSSEAVVDRMRVLKDSLDYDAFDAVPLPSRDAFPRLELDLQAAILARHTPRALRPAAVPLSTLAALLYLAYGINRTNEDTVYPRPFRNVPSAGGLFPLELYFLTFGHVEGLAPGLHHYSPERNCVRNIRPGHHAAIFSPHLYQPDIVHGASLVLFQTALFRRNTFKYKDRGYRFTLIDAGHVAQNINLVATALGLGVWNIGGFQDRPIDRLLGIDGVNHSTIYMHAVGRSA